MNMDWNFDTNIDINFKERRDGRSTVVEPGKFYFPLHQLSGTQNSNYGKNMNKNFENI